MCVGVEIGEEVEKTRSKFLLIKKDGIWGEREDRLGTALFFLQSARGWVLNVIVHRLSGLGREFPRAGFLKHFHNCLTLHGPFSASSEEGSSPDRPNFLGSLPGSVKSPLTH